jgi:cobalt-zinc-cadmium efflux system membrane fusion protein
MKEHESSDVRGRVFPLGMQMSVVAACAGVAAVLTAVFLLAPSGSTAAAPGMAAAPSGRFHPTAEQLRTLKIVPVTEHVFRTRIVTDGYLAPGGGSASGALDAPILEGQSDALLQAEADLTSASGQVRLAEAAEKRQHDLYLSDGAAQKDWQQSQADLATARAQQASARNRLRVLGRTAAGIAAVENPRRGADGTPGEFSVRNFSTLWIVANVREADAGSVHLGDALEVSVPAYPGRRFQAAVGYRGAMIDPVSHRLQIGARIRNDDHLLMPNMQATVTLLAGDASRSPAVPSEAVIYDGGNARVWVFRPDGSLDLRSVTAGRLDGDLLEIVRGLRPGDRVVSSGALFVDSAGTTGE